VGSEMCKRDSDNIEQKIDDIDQEIAELQVKRSRLVQQHPRIDE
ncbi:hypothetical protein V3C21_24875, partial [Salmonella enterica subsp. enterica serovar Paratyphi B]